MNRTPCIVLLLAGGQGCRMHSLRPKQFLTVEGAPVLAYPLRTFQHHDEIDRIYVVCAPEWSDFVERLAEEEGISKFVRTIPSGTTSIDSIRNGIEGIRQDYSESNPVVMLHEAVRPLVSDETIGLNLKTFRTYGNAVTAIRSHEAYMVSSDGISSSAGIPREQLFRAQTPQTFFLNDIEEAFTRAEQARTSCLAVALYADDRSLRGKATLYRTRRCNQLQAHPSRRHRTAEGYPVLPQKKLNHPIPPVFSYPSFRKYPCRIRHR